MQVETCAVGVIYSVKLYTAVNEYNLQPRLIADRHIESGQHLITGLVLNAAFQMAGFNPITLYANTGLDPGALVLVPSSHAAGAPMAMANAIRAVHNDTRIIIVSQFPVPDSSYPVISNWRIATAFHNNKFTKEMSDHLKSVRRQPGDVEHDERRYQAVLCSRLQPRVPGFRHPSGNIPLESGILWFINSVLDREYGVGIVEENIMDGNRAEVVYSVYSRLASSSLTLQGIVRSNISSD